jgi:hypothetical protein
MFNGGGRMKKIFLTVLVILLAIGLVGNVFAQGLPYLFKVPTEVVHVYWNADGTMDVDYTWTFANLSGSHPIDFVDVGTVNSTFDISKIKASVDGVPVSVSTSDYQGSGSGFAIVMGNKTIPANSVGNVHVFIPGLTNVLAEDTNDQAYASAVFAPTYFGSGFVTGSTNLTVTYHFPPNMKPEEPRWHESPRGFSSEPQTGFDDNGRITYTWTSSSAGASEYYQFGSSFPRSYVPADAIYIPPPEPLISSDTMFTIFMLCCFGFFFIGLPFINARAANRRKMQYLPPKISIEGHGIKRGLTAVESAILMEQPLDKVMTMILFGVIKKNAASVKTREPLELDITDPEPEGLHEYEKNFIKAFKNPDKKARQTDLQTMMVGLVKGVSEKMRGFSRRETLDYYKSIMEKAWAQVESADTPEVKSQKFDEALEWTMLDKDYDDRTRRVFHGPVYVPMWWGRYDPTYHPTSHTPTVGSGPFPVSGKPASSGGNALPGADFAASMVTGVQTFSQKVIGNVNTFTEKVTGATNPTPKPTVSSRGGGGGRSCACACACAGCACACAGGGR